MTDLPRYDCSPYSGFVECTDGAWVKWGEVSARLQQLEQEKARLLAALKNLYAMVEGEARWLLEDDINAERALEAIAKAEGR